LIKAHPSRSKNEVETAVKRLEGFLCVKKIYLYAKTDFTELHLAPGKKIRVGSSKPGSGVEGYQVTQFGKETLDAFPSAKLKKLWNHCWKKFAEDYLVSVIIFLLGMLLSSLFGWDLQKLLKTFGR